jgi:hypothetical protein
VDFVLGPLLLRKSGSAGYRTLTTRPQRRSCILHKVIKNQTVWSESARELYLPCGRRLSAKFVSTSEDRGCCVVSATDPYGSIIDFLDREPLV